MVRNEQDENMENNGGDAEEKPFSAMLLHHVMEPTHLGEMDEPDGHAVITGPCGDTDEFFVPIFTVGYGRSVSGRPVVFLQSPPVTPCYPSEGRTVREGIRITQEAVIEYLGGLPDDHKHCALLAANTLHKALKAYIVRGTGL